MNTVAKTATILNGASLSDAVEIDEGMLVGMVLPAAWTAANITLQGAADNAVSTFNNLYDVEGTEVTIVASASRYVALVPADFAGLKAVKVRSGTNAVPVNQGGDRSITLVIMS